MRRNSVIMDNAYFCSLMPSEAKPRQKNIDESQCMTDTNESFFKGKYLDNSHSSFNYWWNTRDSFNKLFEGKRRYNELRKSSKDKAIRVAYNLYFLNDINGMYYYGNDYIKGRNIKSVVIIANKKIYNKIRKLKPNYKVIRVDSLIELIFIAFRLRKDILIFSPTAHPIPIMNRRQLCVVHDSYPFNQNNKIKRLIFRAMYKLTSTQVGYINETDSKQMCNRLLSWCKGEKSIFMPNFWPSINLNHEKKQIGRNQTKEITAGLLGTNSSKKNYDMLFRSICRLIPKDEYPRFLIYGQANKYTEKLINDYKDIDITVINSESVEINEYLGSIDTVCSASREEGFNRPIAFALNLGITVHTLTTEVYKEFYGDSIVMHSHIESLVLNLKKSIYCSPAYWMRKRKYINEKYERALLRISK